MNRLRGMRCYLAGSMDRIEGGGIQWRQEITPLLNAKGVVVMNPCDKPYVGAVESLKTRKKRHEEKAKGNLNAVAEVMKPVCDTDIHMVNVSDFLIVSIDMSVHMCGSYEEISIANFQNKPILCWVRQGRNEAPDWLLGRLPLEFFFSSVEEIIDYLGWVNKTSLISKRWFTPKYDMLYDPAVL